MIIPRYQGGLSSQPINTGRSLGTGIAGAEALTNPNDPNINLEFTVISSCGCTL